MSALQPFVIVAAKRVILLICHSVIWGNLMKTVIDLPFPLSQSLNGTPYRSFYAVVPQFS